MVSFNLKGNHLQVSAWNLASRRAFQMFSLMYIKLLLTYIISGHIIFMCKLLLIMWKGNIVYTHTYVYIYIHMHTPLPLMFLRLVKEL